MRARGAAAAAICVVSIVLAAEPVSNWRSHVPEKEGAVADPLPVSAENAAAGEELYKRNCATCHGAHAEGRGRRPALNTAAMREASDGELFWLLRNGSLAHGMPSWSRLPEAERWQLIQYLRTLPE